MGWNRQIQDAELAAEVVLDEKEEEIAKATCMEIKASLEWEYGQDIYDEVKYDPQFDDENMIVYTEPY